MPGAGQRKAKSKAQAGYLGAVAGGKTKKKGLAPAEARDMLRGVKVSKLPKRKTSKKGR